MKKYCTFILAAAFVAGNLSAQTLSDYQSVVTSQGPGTYFKLNGSLESATDPVVLLQNLTPNGGYATDVYGNTANSFFFVIQGDYLRTGVNVISGGGESNILSSAKGSISFLFRTLPSGINTGQRYVFSGGGSVESHNALTMFLENTNVLNGDPNSYKLRFGNDTVVVLPAADVIPSTWYYFALTYDESAAQAPNKATWYIGPAGGTLVSKMTTNSAESVAGDAGMGGQYLYIGSHTNGNAGFRSPGSGRIDEFAIWSRALSYTEITNQFAKLPALLSGVLVTNVIVNDSFADANRTNTGPLQADWWSSSSTNGNSVEAYPNQLGLISGTSGRGLHGTFAPQNLGIGDTIRVTFTFTTPATVGSAGSTALKVALMDFNNAGLAADLTSASTFVNPLYVGQPGYMADLDVNTGAAADISVREHDVASGLGRFLGTTSEWLAKGSSADAGYVFTPNTEYVGVFSITRTEADGVDIFCSMSQDGSLMDSYADSDSGETANNFGMFGVWVNSNMFGSSTTPGESEDNGITFSNIKVEVVTRSTQAPTLDIARQGGNVVLSWTATGNEGYNLESTPSLSAPVWTGAGAPTVVGEFNFVTNSLTGTNKFYRLKN